MATRRELFDPADPTNVPPEQRIRETAAILAASGGLSCILVRSHAKSMPNRELTTTRPNRARTPTIWMALLIAALVLGGALFVSSGLRGPRAAAWEARLRSGAARGFNVLLITLDTVRRDRLGCYGDAEAVTPNIDALATRGVLFDDAVTSVPITLPSHATILTGRFPPLHGVRDNGRDHLAAVQRTLAEELKASGYATAAFVGCFVLDRRYGLDQGFDVYDFEVSAEGNRPQMADFNERSAAAVTNAALGWLAQRAAAGATAPFFAWVHYFDAHLPYTSPLERQPRFAGRPYDAEIAYVDQQLGRLVAALDDQGLRERTLIAVMADHGEALGDHGEPTHAYFVYAPTMRVPLILSCPALFEKGYRVTDRVVGLVDVYPTIVDLLGIEPPASTDGRSLASAADPQRAFYMETRNPLHLAGWSPLYALRTHTAKYIEAPRPEFYDLQVDPGESKNLVDAAPAALADLKQRLDAYLREVPAASTDTRAATAEEMARLGALGYVQSGAPPPSGPLPDPKDMLSVYLDALRAEQLYGRRKYGEAASVARAVLKVADRCAQAQRILAFSYLKLGQPDQALKLLRSAVARHPDAFLVRSLVQALIIHGELDDALAMLELYEQLAPRDGRVFMLRGDCLAQRGLLDEARAAYTHAAEIDENRVGLTARERITQLNNAAP